MLAGETERWTAHLSWRQFAWLYFCGKVIVSLHRFIGMAWPCDLVAHGGMTGLLGDVRCPERK
jgi:hypothetical protein